MPVFAALALFAPSGQSGGGMSVFLIQMAVLVGIFYFLLIRPQRQQQARLKALLDSLAKGDQVVTNGGVVGEVIHIKDSEVTIRSGESRLVVLRSSIASVPSRQAPVEKPKEIAEKK